MGALAVGAGIAGLHSLTRTSDYRAWGKLRRRGRSTVATLAEGTPVKLIGRITPGEPSLTAPLSGRPCVAWRIVVRGKYTIPGTKYPSELRFEIEDRSTDRLVIDDGTGVATIEPDPARFLLIHRNQTRPLHDVPLDRLLALTARRGYASPTIDFWEEGVLLAGDEIVVGGLPMREPAPEAPADERGYRDAPAMCWHLRGSAEHPVRICDQPSGF